MERQGSPSSGSSDASDILDMRDEEGWEDAEPDVEETQFISLMDDEVFTDLMQMLNHCKEKHNLDFLGIRSKLGLDFYGNIKLVNYLRSQVHSGQSIPSDLTRKDFDDEKYLKPVLEDDAVLFTLDDLPEVVEIPYETDVQDKGKGVERDSGSLIARVSELEEELRKVHTQFSDYRDTVKTTLDKKWDEAGVSGSAAPKEEKRDDDSHYFSSYSYNGNFVCSRLETLLKTSRHS
jgi:protein arginine N-methyltransferase 3